MAKTKTAAPAAGSFDDMLGTNETTAASKKKAKEDGPALVLPDNLKQAFLNYLEHKKNMKDQESLMREAESLVLDFCKNKFDEDGLAGKFTHTYDVKSGDKKAKFITTDKFSIGQENDVINKAKDLLGNEFAEVVGQEKEVVMNPDVFLNAELQAELVKLLGDKFGKFFTTVKKWVVKKGYNEKMHKIAGNKDKLTQIREVIVPAKPYLK